MASQEKLWRKKRKIWSAFLFPFKGKACMTKSNSFQTGWLRNFNYCCVEDWHHVNPNFTLWILCYVAWQTQPALWKKRWSRGTNKIGSICILHSPRLWKHQLLLWFNTNAGLVWSHLQLGISKLLVWQRLMLTRCNLFLTYIGAVIAGAPVY
jgi:hypothetical protein